MCSHVIKKEASSTKDKLIYEIQQRDEESWYTNKADTQRPYSKKNPKSIHAGYLTLSDARSGCHNLELDNNSLI